MGEIGEKTEGIKEPGPPAEDTSMDGYEQYMHGGNGGSAGEGTDLTDKVHEAPGPSEGYVDKPLREFRENYPKEYIEPDTTSGEIEPFSDPKTIAEGTNPKYEEGLPYQVNCADCARSVEDTWRGRSETAAGLIHEEGEPRERMERWAGEKMQDVEKMDDIKQQLEDGGPGSSAVIGTLYKDEHGETYGHFFNAVNDGGTVKVIDGQLGESYDWSPGSGHPYLSDTSGTFAYGRNGKGDSLWHA